MFKRHQLPVASPISIKGLINGLFAAITGSHQRDLNLERSLLDLYDAKSAVLTNSGTNALAEAIRIAIKSSKNKVVALPAYACADLITAAKKAGASILLYDTDPDTLSPDMESLESMIRKGSGTIVAAHLYGIPADMLTIRDLANKYNVVVIEDCAQTASSRIDGKLTGTFGDLTILSFGRGKGTTAGSGGALLAVSDRFSADVSLIESSLPKPGLGIKNLIITAITWMIGRPIVYAIPASIPQLGLGETHYKAPVETTRLSVSGRRLLRESLKAVERTRVIRAANASRLLDALRQPLGPSDTLDPFDTLPPLDTSDKSDTSAPLGAPGIRAIKPISNTSAGYLRLPILLDDNSRVIPELGIARGYPKTLDEYPEIDSMLLNRDTSTLSGAKQLAAKLYTLPTHHMLNDEDIIQLKNWLTSELRHNS